MAHFRFLEAYRGSATGSDVVARTRELKKRHRTPLVMPDDQRRSNYRRKRRFREDEADEDEYEASDMGEDEAEEGGEEGGSEASQMEERKMVFDQNEFGEKLRKYFWQHGPEMVHMGLAHLGKGLPWKKLRRECPGLSFLVPQIYLEDIADKQRLSEIEVES